MKKLIIIAGFISSSFFQKYAAQEASGSVALHYSMGFAIGDMNDFISAPSFRGITFEYHKLVQDNIGVGFEIGWNAFYERKDYATYTKDTRSLTGVQFRYCDAVPMLATVNYYFSPDQQITPFVGLGIGTQYTQNYLSMGMYALTENVWHFAMKPEIGVNFNVNEMFAITMVGKFYGAFKSGDIGTRNYIAANVGFTWKI